MNKKLNILVAAALSAVTAVNAVGCNKGNTQINHENPVVVQSTEFDLVKGGKTAYKIIVPAEATRFEVFAADELVYFFEQATGITLEIVKDTGVSTSTQNTYLSVGNTTVFAQSGIAVTEEELGPSGFKLQRKDKTIIMAGYREYGTLNAVYEFLHVAFGFRCYYADEIALAKNVTDLKLPDFNITDRPDIDLRCANYGDMMTDSTFAYRMRTLLDSDIWMNIDGSYWHNSFKYLPPATYAEEHRDWYYYGNGADKDPTQLDYTNDEMRLQLTENLKKYILANPTLENVTITHEDNRTWCDNAANKALVSKYGTNAASMILFCNKVAADIREWLATVSPGRKVNIVMFAYYSTEKAPVTYNQQTGQYEPIDGLKLDEGVSVFYAPINADYNCSAYSSDNTTMYETLKAWTALSERVYLWLYSTNFAYYLAMFNSFDSMQSMYRMAKEANAYYLFDQGQHSQSNAVGFSRLKMFLNSQLGWNVNADMDALIDEFFENYYKAAEPAMRKLFDSMRLHYAYLRDETDMPRNIYANVYKSSYFPKGVLDEWMRLIDEAYASIEDLKESDAALYQKLEQRIRLESLTIRYMVIQIYGSTYTDADLREMKLQFKADATQLGVSRYQEIDGAIRLLWEQWGV